MVKFIDKTTNDVVEVPNFKIRFDKKVGLIYVDEFGEQLKGVGGIPLAPEKVEFNGCPTQLKFKSSSDVDKRRTLQKRSHEDYKKNVEERKQHLQGKAIEQLKGIVGVKEKNRK